jgi:cytochrome c-type biogenesis protein
MSALFALSFVAGVVSILNPCVIPLVPLIVGAALQSGRWGLFVLMAGVVTSFVIVGTVLAATGSLLGIEAHTLRILAGALIVVSGIILLSPQLAGILSQRLQPLANFAHQLSLSVENKGYVGQFFLGLLLGVVWAPCTGPTLGVAIGLAAQSQTVWQAALMMFIFGLGAASFITLLGLGFKKIFAQRRGQALQGAQHIKKIFGGLMLILGVLIVTGFDKRLEAVLLSILPQGWLDITTRF